MHPSILKTNRFLIFLRQEKSTAIVNLAITHELQQPKWKICRKPGFSCPGFPGIQSDSLIYDRENKESVSLVSFIIKFWFCG